MSTNPDQVAINMTELANTTTIDETDGRHNKHHTPKSNGHSPRPHRNGHHENRHNGHDNRSYDDGSETDTEDEGDSDHSHSHSHHHRHHHHRSRSTSRDRNHSHSPAVSRRTRRDVEAVTPERPPRTGRDIQSAIDDAEPLLVTDLHPKPTIKNTELDDSTPDENIPNTVGNHPGVDDGFFSATPGTTPSTDIDGPEIGTRVGGDDAENIPKINPNGLLPRPEQPTTPFPFAPGFNPSVILDANGNPQVIPDINVYQQKKNLAQGMMDLALLSANANQLRYVIESYPRHPYYWFSFVSITLSLILQVAVGVGLILNSRYNVKNRDEICRADKINNATIIGIFLITTVNVFISAFGVADSASLPGQT